MSCGYYLLKHTMKIYSDILALFQYLESLVIWNGNYSEEVRRGVLGKRTFENAKDCLITKASWLDWGKGLWSALYGVWWIAPQMDNLNERILEFGKLWNVIMEKSTEGTMNRYNKVLRTTGEKINLMRMIKMKTSRMGDMQCRSRGSRRNRRKWR